MTVFEIKEEKGLSRRLVADNTPPTPWLLQTKPYLNVNGIRIHQVILSKRGYLPLLTPWRDISDADDYDPILSDLPEWTILTPRLYPASENLGKSLTYELNLFLDRLDNARLPDAFGLVFDPLHNQPNHLNELLSYNPSLIVLRYPSLQGRSPRKFVKDLLDIRERVPANIAIYLPGSGGIGFQTLLIALGIDIVDDMAAFRNASRNRGFIDGMIRYEPHDPVNELAQNNLKALKVDFDHLMYHLDHNTVWTRLARDMHTHPSIATAVKLLGTRFQSKIPLEKFSKFEENDLQFTGPEGLTHPDVLAFQKRLLNRYQIPPQTRVVVLLPCSARKPYVESYSHRKYGKAIAKGAKGAQACVTVWSLTSPLGVVPRELETVYPAQNYDIPVTGEWTVAEIEKCGQILVELLDKLPDNMEVIAHVSSGYKEMIEYAKQYKKITISWMGDGSRSSQALDTLTRCIVTVLNSIAIPDITEKLYFIESRDIVQAITRFHHGRQASLKFDPGSVRFVGRPPRPIQVQKNKKHWITWDKLVGNVRLSHRAILEIALDSDNWIILNAESLRGSNLFGVAIIQASTSISPGDEVIFFNADKTTILGLGVARISGLSMNQVNSGLVATIRKKMNFHIQKGVLN